MRNMREHADELDWAASWFKWFYYLNLFGIALVIILIVLIILMGRSSFQTSKGLVYSGDLIAQGVGAILGGLVVAFIWRACFIICKFLADFARGLLSQQIRREHQAKEPT